MRCCRLRPAGRCIPWMVLTAAGLTAAARAQSGPVAQTAHYEVHVEGQEPEAEAEELGRVLEAAWPRFAEFFRAEPRGQKGKRFVVRVYADRESWRARIENEGAAVPADLDHLWYRPESETVHVVRNASAYMTRSFVIQGACQQFFCRAKRKNDDLVHAWYLRGLSEHFAMHRWDGGALELGAVLAVEPKDLARRALGRWRATAEGDERLEADRFDDAAVAWAMVDFLTRGEDGRHRDRLHKLALGRTGSKLDGEAFARSLGPAAQIEGALVAWLRSRIPPWEILWGDWEELDAGTVRGRAFSGAWAFCVLRAPAPGLEATVEGPAGSSAGLLLDYQSEHRFLVAVVEGESLEILQVEQGVPTRVQSAVVGTDERPPRLALHLAEDGLTLQLGARTVWRGGGPSATTGLAVRHGSARFSDLRIAR